MNEQRKQEIEERLKYYFGTPRTAPTKHPSTAEEWEEVDALTAELEAMYKKDGKIIKADNYFLPVSKLAKNAVKMINEYDGRNDEILTVDKRKNISVRLQIGYDEQLLLPENYSLYLDTVQMTIGSLIDCGAQVVTAEQVYRTMNGLTSDDYVTPQAVGAVTKAMRQLRNLWVTIDRSEEVKAYPRLKNLISVIQQKAILPYNETITIKNQAGREITAYKIDKLPPLYEYSKDRGEIRSLPGDLLKIEGLNTSKQNTAIKIWLLQQIESMKPGSNGKHRDNTIKINTLLEALKYDIDLTATTSTARVKRTRYIKQTKKMLDSWKACGYIKGYKENHSTGRGKALESITIFLPDQK